MIDPRLQRPIGFECCFDGWAKCSAERFLYESAGFWPIEYQHIPLYVPPGATANAPYGPAGFDCPYIILAKGTPLEPSWRIPAEKTFEEILCLLNDSCMNSETTPF